MTDNQVHTFEELLEMELLREFRPTSVDEIKDIIAESGIKSSTECKKS